MTGRHHGPRHRSIRGLAWAAALGLALADRGPALAAPAVEERTLSAGVDRPIHDISAEGDASSMELNPALLSAIRGVDVALLGYQTLSEFVRGSGFGGFVAANLRFGLALGFGAQFMQPRLGGRLQDFARDRNPATTKLTWALSTGFGEKAAFGLALHGLRSDGRWLRRPDLDVGLMTRIRNHGSIGLTLRLGPTDLRDDAYASQVFARAEVAIRPLGNRILELAGGVGQVLAEGNPGEKLRTPGGTQGLLPRGRIALRWHGIGVLGEVEQIRTTLVDDLSLQPLRRDKALRGSVAVELAWDYTRGRVGLHAGVGSGVDGVGFEAHVGTSRQDRVFWPRRVDAERIDVSEIGDERELIELLGRLERARSAGARSILVVESRGAKLGWASLHEVRQALVRVRNAGGHVFAYLDNAGLKDYYLGSVAQKVYVHPAGSLGTYGIARTQLYFKGVLDKLGVAAEVLRVDDYKSAAEPFTETGPSPADRRQKTELLGDIYTQVVKDVAQGRQLPVRRVRSLFDGAPHSPVDAVENRLADEVVFRDELLAQISATIGATVEFRRFADTDHEQETWSTAPYVAVVLVEGMIIDGKSRFIPLLNLQFTGGDTIAETLQELRKDRACKGIVLRVNSGGGSALASDIIWREVALTAQAHTKDPKFEPPIVVSMGDTAASGGYYVAMGSRTVVADPMTVTGSIGVISLHLDLSGLLAKVGIDKATFKEGLNADIQSPWQPYTDDQRTRLTAQMEQIYGLFRQRVADGRELDEARVRELAGGRIYSGVDAKAAGLIDHLGGLTDAIALVRKQAGLPSRADLEVRVVPDRMGLVELILDALGFRRGRGERPRRAQARVQERRRGLSLPAGVDLSRARAPLSVVFLPPGQAHTLLPWTW